MVMFRLFLTFLFITICGCSAASHNSVPLMQYDSGEVMLWKPCSRSQAEVLAGSTERKDILESGACSAWLLESGTVKSADYAKTSQQTMKKYLDKNPQSGIGHYLLAYLVAKEAQLAPMRGLDLVPVVEHEALLASRLSPEVDFAGPDRMLGELYLKAPSPPLSIGNMDNALKYYDKAVKVAPDFALNHLGYAAALLEDDEKDQACVQYKMALKSKSFDEKILNIDTYAKLPKVCQ
ncbi:tetratricopeptide repeat protein [Maridesulfovibrio zosterae]|uniref:tetratricopeptide repeat protein n=1 Tax=Maridesulfovibrio zosterae TaxID=82171 RepID=UPI000417B290|nr:hypothetical protein [Maridesulfovibrio zosterae]